MMFRLSFAEAGEIEGDDNFDFLPLQIFLLRILG